MKLFNRRGPNCAAALLMTSIVMENSTPATDITEAAIAANKRFAASALDNKYPFRCIHSPPSSLRSSTSTPPARAIEAAVNTAGMNQRLLVRRAMKRKARGFLAAIPSLLPRHGQGHKLDGTCSKRAAACDAHTDFRPYMRKP